jgi:two-component system alkaline phosphatase synthesis response regulator PhoP
MPKKILIIDDEEDMRIFLETLFRKAGYETFTAGNGDEALAHLSASPPDLITLDILMPKKSGLSFFQVLRTQDHLKEVPVIVLSGVTNHADFFAPDELTGPTTFVDKPVEPQVLLDKAKSMLGE